MKMKHELSDINPQKMDSQKWDMLLDLLEHPEKYSETQKDELLGDEEVNEFYLQLVETRQSLDFAKSKEKMKMPSIDAEWEKLKDEMKLKEEKQQKEEMSQDAVKRFYKEDGHYRLQPENDFMDPIIVDNVEIVGKVIGLIRLHIS